MNIWHVCDISCNPSNGMYNVVPMHARAQSGSENVVLLNLHSDYMDAGNGVNSLTGEDYRNMGFEGIESRYGKADLVVFHGIYLPKIWSFCRRHVMGRIPYIVVPHGSCAKEAQKKSRIKKMLANWIVAYSFTRKALAVQFLCKREYEDADKRFFKQYIIAANGIEEKTCKVKEYTPGNEIKLTYIGRLDINHKGLDLLLYACAELRDYLTKHRVKVQIYGGFKNGCEKPLQQMVEQLNLDNIVTVNDAVYGEEKKKILLEETTYFVMTSRYEGQPMAALEALSYGVPIIVTEGTGFSAEVEQYRCGFTSKGDIPFIARALKEACERVESQAELSQNALKCVSQYYWEKIGQATIEKYRNIVCID